MTDFYQKYFTFPLFKNEGLEVYKAMGDKSITENFSLWNPLQLYRTIRTVGKRMKEQDIEGNYVGEGLKKGGVLLFDKDGRPQYMYPEETGTPFDMDELKAALQSIRDGTGGKVRDDPASEL